MSRCSASPGSRKTRQRRPVERWTSRQSSIVSASEKTSTTSGDQSAGAERQQLIGAEGDGECECREVRAAPRREPRRPRAALPRRVEAALPRLRRSRGALRRGGAVRGRAGSWRGGRAESAIAAIVDQGPPTRREAERRDQRGQDQPALTPLRDAVALEERRERCVEAHEPARERNPLEAARAAAASGLRGASRRCRRTPSSARSRSRRRSDAPCRRAEAAPARRRLDERTRRGPRTGSSAQRGRPARAGRPKASCRRDLPDPAREEARAARGRG